MGVYAKVISLGLLLCFMAEPALSQCPPTNWSQFCGPVADVGRAQFNSCLAKCKAEWQPANCGGSPPPGNTCETFFCVQGKWKAQATKPGAQCTLQGKSGACSNSGICIPSATSGSGSSGSGFTATIASAITSPQYVNLYWDSTWDADNPMMSKGAIDTFTSAMLASSYFGGLGEYGITSQSFGGGFLPAPACPQRAPSNPGYYDPFNPSIAGFLQCEIDHGNVPTGPNVIYNIILPSYAIESDFFGLDTFCPASGGATAWHFHGTPYDPAVSATLALSLLAGIPPLETLLGLMGSLLSSSGPVYTITMAAPMCGGLTGNLFHEMVEAATDPFPPVNVALSGTGEIADQCTGSGAASPFAAPSTAGNILPGPNQTEPFASSASLSVPSYWSNLKQLCTSGFTDQSLPAGSIQINSGQGGTLSMTIGGTGLGMIPAPFRTGTMVTLPYLGIQDLTQGWQAGNSLNGDLLTANVSGWSANSITIAGIGRAGTPFTMRSGDQLSAWMCNPASGNCFGALGGQIVAPAGPYLPNLALALIITNPKTASPFVSFSIDGKSTGSLFGNGSASSWFTLSIGAHQVKATIPGANSSLYKIGYGGHCSSNGSITLAEGENQTCAINVTNLAAQGSSGCGEGQTCCESGVKSCKRCLKLKGNASCP